jgi:hypothetical protein
VRYDGPVKYGAKIQSDSVLRAGRAAYDTAKRASSLIYPTPRIYLAILTSKGWSHESIGERVHSVSSHGGARAMGNVGGKARGFHL